jgi:hypothetical protein
MVDVLNTDTMALSKNNGKFNPNDWIVLEEDEPFAIVYHVDAVEVFDSDRDDLRYYGFKLARGCGHNSIYPHRYYRESE